MDLKDLLDGVEGVLINGSANIKSLACDSRRTGAQALFFCIAGAKTDGHDYAHDAIKNGAAALVTARRLPVSLPQVLVKDVREAMSVIAGNFYGNPVRAMKLITVTGTNGKTSTTYILKSIAEAAGIKAAVIGTAGVIIDGKVLPATLTTPDPIELHALFAGMREAGAQWVIMEASAHAIFLKKLAGIRADVAAFTNLTRDHLDFFGTMERYKSVKSGYFCKENARVAVINADDDTGVEILNNADLPCFTYGVCNPADIFAINYEADESGLSYVLNLFDRIVKINFPLPGKYNMYNTLCAALIAGVLDVDVECIARGIEAAGEIPGRFNITPVGKGRTAIIDYAHTPDGLLNLLRTVREFAAGRIITVFGCGGDRDRTKRAEMGLIAGGYSDFVIVTSDNPRSEEPDSIIAEACAGLDNTDCAYVRVTDRRMAIEKALALAKARDIIVIAGKGDEPYIEIRGEKLPYSDKDALAAALEKEKTVRRERRKKQ